MNSQKDMLINDLVILIDGYNRVEKNNNKISQIKKNNHDLTVKLIINKMRKLILLPYIIYLVLWFIGILPKIYDFIYIVVYSILGSIPMLIVSLTIILATILVPVSYYKVGNAVKNSKNSIFDKIPFYKRIIDNGLNDPEVVENEHEILMIQRNNSGVRNIIEETGVYDRIPRDYTNLYTVSSLFTYLYNQRADTLKEAINLFETEEHQHRMEHHQKRILQASERAEINSRIAAMNAYSAMKSSEKARSAAEIAANRPVTVHVNVEKF